MRFGVGAYTMQLPGSTRAFCPGLAYADDGAPTIRRSYGVEDVEEIMELVMRFALEGKSTATSGKVIDVEGDSVCVHGNVTNSPGVLHGLRAALGRAGIEVRSALRAGKAAPGPREGVRA
jgi:UPF0271 protein